MKCFPDDFEQFFVSGLPVTPEDVENIVDFPQPLTNESKSTLSCFQHYVKTRSVDGEYILLCVADYKILSSGGANAQPQIAYKNPDC